MCVPEAGRQCYNINMRQRTRRKLIGKLKEQLNNKTKQLYATPAEVRLIQIMGGRTLTIHALRSAKSGLPVTLVLSRGKYLRREHFRRTGDRLILFSNDIKWALALQGREYERDVVAAYERDQKMQANGWRVKYIRADWLWNKPELVRQDVLQFLA